MLTKEAKDALMKLREPFSEREIDQTPEGLSYVGHANLTKRLLDVDPAWNWDFVFQEMGGPVIDKDGGMWIRMTICGMTRLGYGDAGSRTGPNAMKERIGDALRNAGMRFGMALDLWMKGDKRDTVDARKNVKASSNAGRIPSVPRSKKNAELKKTEDPTPSLSPPSVPPQQEPSVGPASSIPRSRDDVVATKGQLAGKPLSEWPTDYALFVQQELVKAQPLPSHLEVTLRFIQLELAERLNREVVSLKLDLTEHQGRPAGAGNVAPIVTVTDWMGVEVAVASAQNEANNEPEET